MSKFSSRRDLKHYVSVVLDDDEKYRTVEKDAWRNPREFLVERITWGGWLASETLTEDSTVNLKGRVYKKDGTVGLRTTSSGAALSTVPESIRQGMLDEFNAIYRP